MSEFTHRGVGPLRRGCPHHNHSVYCVEMNTTWCEDCASIVSLHHQGILDDEGRAIRLTITPLAQIERLVKEDLSKIKLVQACTDAALYECRRESLSGTSLDEALDAEAVKCRDEVDRMLIRVVQMVQATRDRLYDEIDAHVQSRRMLLASLHEHHAHLTALVNEVREAMVTSPDEDAVVGLVVAAQLLAKLEERSVHEAEQTIESLFPSVATVEGGPTKAARRQRMTLPNGHEVFLSPFHLRLSSTLLQPEFDRVHVKDARGVVPNLSSSGAAATTTGIASSTALPLDHLATSLVKTKSATNVHQREHGKWKAYQGVGVVAARKRNIRTPDPLSIAL